MRQSGFTGVTGRGAISNFTEIGKSFNVSQETVSRRLRAVAKIHKLGTWAPHDLNEGEMKNCKLTCETLLPRHERKSVLHGL